MRLFTALDLPPDMLQRLDDLLSRLRVEAEMRWSPLANLHVTTKFIGQWPEERMDELEAALEMVSFDASFDVEVGGLGWFPQAGSPRTLWTGAHGSEALPALAAATNEALVQLGVAREEKTYSPHITLARIKSGLPTPSLRAKVEELQAVSIGRFWASSFHLYASNPIPQGANVYRKLRAYSSK